MRSFLIQLSGFLAIHATILAAILWAYEPSSALGFMAATLDKHALLQRTDPPRIILLGGSNLPFGIQSDLLEARLGRPAVNMGLFGGLGMDFMLNEVAAAVGPGDCVVLALEYDLYTGEYNPESLRQILELRPRSLGHLEPFQIGRVLLDDGAFCILGGVFSRIVPLHLKWIDAATPEPPYRRDLFNPHGDLTGHYPLASSFRYLADDKIADRVDSRRLPSRQVLERIEEFARFCQQRGARCVISCPPYPCDAWRAERATISAIYAQLERLRGVTLLDHPEDQCYPVECFYDTGYHLTEAGARERTLRLAEELARVIVSPGSIITLIRSPGPPGKNPG